MALIHKLTAVRSTLARFQSHFAAARARRAELASYATVGELAAALDDASPLPTEQAYALIATLLDEHAQRPHELWTSLLLVAFTPLLLRERKRLEYPEDEERDHLVILAFVGGIGGAAKAGEYGVAALQRATRKGIVAEQKKERAESHSGFVEDVHSPYDPFGFTLAEARAEAAWAARRATRAAALRARRSRSEVRELPRPTGKPRVAA